MSRRWAIVATAVLVAGCAEPSEPHPPKTDEERELARRYTDFAGARVHGEILVSRHGGRVVRVSARSSRSDGARLIAQYEREDDAWRITDVSLGIYAD